MTRREWFAAVAAAANVPDPTKFQLGRMTLPYAAFPLQRALSGIAAAGYRYVVWALTIRSRKRIVCPSLHPTLPRRRRRSGLLAAATSAWGRT